MNNKKPNRKKFSERMTSPIACLKYGSLYAFVFAVVTMSVYSNVSFGHNASCLEMIFFFTLNPLFILVSAPWSIWFHEGLHVRLSYSIATGGTINILILAFAVGLFNNWHQKRRTQKQADEYYDE